MDNCSFCNNERRIEDWREWIKVAREIRVIETKVYTWKECLEISRDMRKGWKGITGVTWHIADCPACMV